MQDCREIACPHCGAPLYTAFRGFEENARAKRLALSKADYFSCAGDLQRLYFLPWLMQAGFQFDDGRVCTIPVSLSPDLPPREFSDEITFVYGGVFLPWQDPRAGFVQALQKGIGIALLLSEPPHPVANQERVKDVRSDIERIMGLHQPMQPRVLPFQDRARLSPKCVRVLVRARRSFMFAGLREGKK